jgi:glycosyltransferase involved in cell wall biosynthesis
LNWLTEKGHDVHLIFPSKEKRARFRYNDRALAYPLPALSVPSYKEYCISLPPLAMSLWFKKWDVDLIHAETINPFLLHLGFRIKRQTGAPMFNVLTANIPMYSPILFPKDNLIKKFCFRLGKRMMNKMSNRIEGTFVLSDGMRKILTQDFYTIDQSKVFTFIRPMDTERFSKASEDSEIFQKYHIPRGNRLLTLSRLCTTKNVEFLIRAFAQYIYPQNKSLHFFIGGHGPLEDRLRILASDYECPNIHFLGRVDFEAVPGLLGQADYFLYASLSETFGNVVCEAKYSKLPVIALDDNAGIRMQIEDKKTGILVKDHDEDKFARRFFEVFNHPQFRNAIRNNAHLDVCINNNPNTVYSRLLRLYLKSINNGAIDHSEIKEWFSYNRTFLQQVQRPT